MARQHRGVATSNLGARHGRLRRSASWANALKVLLTAALVVVVSGVSVGAYAVWGLTKDANIVELVGAPKAQAVGAGSQTLEGELTILLVGSDKRVEGSIMYDGEEGELNDVNLLLHIPADHKSATVISFPRDLMVPIPECTDPETGDVSSAMSEQQINTALSYGGLSCVAATITELTGMEIPYAAMVDFDGVIDITNAIGGVTVCLAQPIEDDMTGLYLPAGEVTVSGVDALNFVRTRYGVGDGSDVSRISNQQVFMSALMRQMRSAETLSNPMKVYSLAKAGFENLTMSSSMASIEFLQKLAGTAVNIDLNRVNFVQYPSGTHPYSPGRLSPDRYSGDQLIDIVMSGVPFEVAGVGRAAVTADGSAPAEAPVEGEAPAEGAAPVEGTAPAEGTEAPPVTVLPPNVTGQSAATQTCSAGRTMY